MKNSDLFLKTERTHRSHRGIIVGFDPGLTVGIAILNLKGNLISLASFKKIRRSEIVSHIINYGKTVLVATDVYTPPKTVRKLASTLNSKIWSPYRSMSVESKIDIVDSYIQDIGKEQTLFELPQNAHERDALAAAVKTYRDHLNKFRQIEKRAEKAELSYDAVDSIKIRVINGTSISNAIEQISEDIKKVDSILTEHHNTTNGKDNESELKIKPSIGGYVEDNILKDSKGIKDDNGNLNSDDVLVSKLKHKLKSQQRYIDKLKQKNIILEDEVHVYQAKISKLQSKVDKLHYEYTKKILQKRELASKIALIKNLQEKYSNEKAKRSELEQKFKSRKDIKAVEISENAVPVKIIESFTKEGIREACDRWKIKKDDVVLLKNSEGGGSQTASMIIQLGVKAVITMDKISDPAENIFEKNMIPLVPASSVEMNSMHEFAIVNSETLRREIERWSVQVNKQKKNEDKKKLLKLVDEYRAQRRRSADQ
jgi:predicted RNase H-like nuclease (RuvC/YqgF family)